MEKLRYVVKIVRLISIYCIVLASANSHSNSELASKVKGLVTDAGYIVFGVKVGGEMSCGHYQMLIHEFGRSSELSCESDSVTQNLKKFNEELGEFERFIVLWSVKGDLKNGDLIDVKNSSQSGFEFGEKYLLFLTGKNGFFQLKDCSFFNSSFYKDIFKSNEEANSAIIIDYVTKNRGMCNTK